VAACGSACLAHVATRDDPARANFNADAIPRHVS
jgi:hypothetical protein